MKKVVLCTFRGEAMCFVHVLLNAFDMTKKGIDAKIVIEGEAVKLIPEMEKPEHFLNKLYWDAKEKGFIIAVCQACSQKLGVFDAVSRSGLPVVNDMSGHVSLGRFIEEGFQIITF
jgi:hypothetical protein